MGIASGIIADTNNDRVQKFDSTGQFLCEWGERGTGPGEFYELWGLDLNASGEMYVTDVVNNRIQKFGGVILGTTNPDDVQYTLSVSPNPSNSTVTIVIHLSDQYSTQEIMGQVFDIRGRLIRTIGQETPGGRPTLLTWNGENDQGFVAPDGLYMIRILSNGNFVGTKKVIRTH